MSQNRKSFHAPIRISVYEGQTEIVNRIFTHFPVVLGRGPQCDIPLVKFDFISRQHCAIIEENGEAVIVDLNSSNGFFFQGQKAKRAPIIPDADVRIGALKVVFEFQAPNPTAAATATKKREDAPAKIPVEQLANLDIPKVAAPKIPTAPVARGEEVTEASQTAQSIRNNLDEQVWLHAQNVKAQGKPSSGKSGKPTKAPPSVSQKPKKPAPSVTELEPLHETEASHFAHDLNPDPVMGKLFDKLLPHPSADKIKPNQRVLEGFVTWTDQVYDVQAFSRGQKVSVGSDMGAGLHLPTLRRNVNFAYFDSKGATCFVPQGSTVEVRRAGKVLSMSDLMSSQALVQKNNGYVLKLGDQDLCSVELDPKIRVHFRYAPAPRQLAKSNISDASDEEVRRSTLISGFIHLFIAILAALNAPNSHGPKIPNVDDRYARLLVEPPRQILPEPKKEEPKKEEPKKEIAKKREIVKEKIVRKIQPPPRKVVIKQSPVLKQVNKFPMKVQPKPVAAAKPKPVNVEQVGALAALNALSAKPTNTRQPVSININPNAGGSTPDPNMGGTIGLLKTASGRLAAGGGVAGVKTKGLGYGTGSGFGVQGVKGSSGRRGVAGAVIGNPQLMQIGPTEGLTRAQVMAVVQKYIGKIQSCYERSLLQSPGIAGRVEYEWEITAQGKVSDARVKKSEVGDADALNSCVVGVFKTMQFPVAKNGQGTTPNIGFPFGRM